LAQRARGDVIWIAPSEVITEFEQKKLEAAQGQRQLQALVSELIEINYAKAEDIADILKSVRAVDTGISSTGSGSVNVSEVPTETNSLLSERGSVSVDKRTNALLVQDTASKIREIRKLISALDKPVKQVLIETRIVQATDSFSRNIGIRLGFNTLNTGYDLGTVMGSGSLTGTEGIRTAGMNAAARPLAVDLFAGSPADSVASPAAYAFTLAKAGADYANLIDLEISALEAENRGKVIANPRLLTADKKEAKIEQGEERVFMTSSAGSTSTSSRKAVLGLTVTPQITPDDRVILDVFVTQDSWAPGTTQNMNTNQITTQVLLHNGETVIIGGIYNQQLTESVEKVPLLGDLPILGSLFRQKAMNDKRTELLVFLTPRIIKPVSSSN
jgi:type IV pilus assembly protein PilQ